MRKYFKQELLKLYKFLHRKTGFFYAPPRDICAVTGCPRSGTRAMLRWVSQSRQVASFNEPRIYQAIGAFIENMEYYQALYENKDILLKLLRKFFYSYISNQKIIWNKIVVIKEPLGYIVAGQNDLIALMRTIFPGFKAIFMVRHPVSVFNSMKNRKWGMQARIAQPWDMPLDRGISIWKSSVNAYLNNKSANSYLCKFENLISDPERESIKIREFLKIKPLKTFKPKDTAKIDLDEQIVQRILNETEKERKLFDYT